MLVSSEFHPKTLDFFQKTLEFFQKTSELFSNFSYVFSVLVWLFFGNSPVISFHFWCIFPPLFFCFSGKAWLSSWKSLLMCSPSILYKDFCEGCESKKCKIAVVCAHARAWRIEKTKKTHCISWCIFATVSCTGKELPSASKFSLTSTTFTV